LSADDPILREFECWVCGKKGCAHFVEEWDSAIHALCAIRWLADTANVEAQIIIKHRHDVILCLDLEEDP